MAAPRSTPVPCARPGVLLVGDAAHLADPFLGEGIYSAVRSGALAAQAILRGDRESRDRRTGTPARWPTRIWPDLMAASRVAFLFHRMPRWWHHLLSRMPGSLSEVVGVLAGEQSYAGLLRQIVQRVEAQANRWVRHQSGSPRGQRKPGGRGVGSRTHGPDDGAGRDTAPRFRCPRDELCLVRGGGRARAGGGPRRPDTRP